MPASQPPAGGDQQWSPDKDWSEEQWEGLARHLVDLGLVSWKNVAAVVLGELNPNQVGTGLASTDDDIKALYPKGQRWKAVREWLYAQSGKCADCGSRIELQVDHIVPKEQGGGGELDNRALRCRRCNVIKRPSHKQGGLTFLTAQAALMWLLIVCRPKTYEEYDALCRRYGLTMANIRFQESWAMAIWLAKEGKYEVTG